MAINFNRSKTKIFELLPLFLLFYISLNGSSVFNLVLFSINIQYIIIYYWVLKEPEYMGYGFIFLAGVITDIVLGLPIGVTALSLLVVAGFASYTRVVTVRVTVVSNWISFVPALIAANIFYYTSLHFSEFSINYLYLFRDSFFTFLFYPVFWLLFTLILKLAKT